MLKAHYIREAATEVLRVEGCFAGIAYHLLTSLVVGPIFGKLMGQVLAFVLITVSQDPSTSYLMSICAVYATFLLAEEFLLGAGVTAVIALALSSSAHSTSTVMDPDTGVAPPVEGEDASSLEAHQQWLCAESESWCLTKARLIFEWIATAMMDAYPYLMDARREGTIPTAPCIAFSGYNVKAAKSMNIHVDTVWLFEVQDAEDGFTVVMAAYWLFGFTHGQKTYNTSCLLERLCLILIYSQLEPVAIKGQQQLDSVTLRCGDGDAERARDMPPTQCEGQVLPLTG
ncbi:hypothetical protein ISCGN_019471 [Ixodes scapularis]